ncbi:MAG TPA: PAS domain S-box protein [Saprospiraceae bacterium]|nr:PAS domain S-box protein [Saprospiraceae bacterium]
MNKRASSLSQVRIIYIATTFFLVALSTYAFLKINNFIDSSNWVNHTNQVTHSLENISIALIDAEANQKSFLLIGDSSSLVTNDSVFNILRHELNTVDSLTKDNPQQIANLVILRATIEEKKESMKKVLNGYSPLSMSSEFKENIAEGIAKTKNVKQVINRMLLNEKHLLQERSQKYTHLVHAAPILIILLFLGALLILLASFFRLNKAYYVAKKLEKIAIEEKAKFDETLTSKKLLEESEQRYHHLIYSSPSGIGILYGEDLVITIANEPIIAFWGKGKEIMGKKYFEALPELIEQGYEEVFAQVYKTGIPFHAVETPVNLVENGLPSVRYYNFVLYPQRNIDNEVDGIGIIATEVTSQALLNNTIKESEQNYRNLSSSLEEKVKERTAELQTINEALKFSEERYHRMVGEVQDYAIILLSKEGIIENWNKGAENIKGYKAEEIVGKSFSTFYTEEDRANDIPGKLLSIASEKGKASDENWRLRKDGSLFWGSVVITALHDNQDNIIGFVKVTRDLSERKNAEDKLRQNTALLEEKNIDLEKMNKELQSFAYISSHDLQEPLRKIQTFASRILVKEADLLSEVGKDNFKRMQEAARRMQTLIQDLLAYSRTKTTERTFETIDLRAIIDEVKEDLKEELNDSHATIETNDLCVVKIIPFQFRQLMLNLVSNALKFSKSGTSPVIKIKGEIKEGRKFNHQELSPQKRYCHISVTDNGIGFEQQYSEKIFEVFQRLHGKAEYDGTGIGLSIVKKIVENHDGIITASSELNEGASFDIYIPAP